MRFDVLAMLGLALLATAFLWPVVGGGESLAGGDLVNHYLPLRHVVNEAIDAGDWPWWNPWSFSGMPLIANLNAALFYPPNLPLLWLPLERWFSLTVWLHVIGGLIGAFLVQRAVGLGRPAAMFGSIIFWASGFFIFNLHSGIILFHQAGAWWPWAILATLGWVRGGRRAWLALLSVSLACMFLAGAPQVAHSAGMVVGALALTLTVGQPRWRPTLIGFAAAVAVAALLVQVQFLPAREWSSMSQRATWTGEMAWELKTGDSLMPRSLLLAMVPTLCGDPSEGGLQWGTGQGFHEVVPAFMTPALIIVVIGFALRGAPGVGIGAWPRPRRWILLHLILGALALWASFGRHSPLFRLLYLTVPGLSEFRVPARLNLVTLWCLACLSAVMFDRLWRAAAASDGVRRRWAVAGWIVGVLGLAATLLFALTDTQALLLRLGMPAGTEAQIPPGTTTEAFLLRHLRDQPELIEVARTALLRWSIAVAATGVGIAVWSCFRRLSLLGLALIGAAMLQTMPSRSLMETLPTSEYRERLYGESDATRLIRENLGQGRMLSHDTVWAYYHMDANPELFPNRTLMVGLPSARGYDPIVSVDYANWLNAAANLPLNTPAFGRLNLPLIGQWELVRQMNVTVVASHVPLEDPALELLAEDATGLRVHRVRDPGGPARLAFGAPFGTGDTATDLALAAGLAPDQFDPASEVVITDPDVPVFPLPSERPEGTATLVERGFDHAVYEVDAGEQAYLVTDIPHHPGWRAWLDGDPAFVTRGNMTWVAVPVPSGRHRVELRFRPASLMRGALLSVAGLMLTLGLCLPGRRGLAEAPGDAPEAQSAVRS